MAVVGSGLGRGAVQRYQFRIRWRHGRPSTRVFSVNAPELEVGFEISWYWFLLETLVEAQRILRTKSNLELSASGSLLQAMAIWTDVSMKVGVNKKWQVQIECPLHE